MEQQRRRDFEVLCDVLLVILDSYRYYPYLPAWLFNFWHRRAKQVNYIKRKINLLKASAVAGESPEKLEDELVKILDASRFFVSVHTLSNRLRSKIQDAMLTALFFKQKYTNMYQRIWIEKKDLKGFLNELDRTEEIQQYTAYLRKQRSVYGRLIERFSTEDMLLAAKGGMINGKLVDRYGIQKVVGHGLRYIHNELKAVQRQHIEAGFLTMHSIDNYAEKLDLILHPANELAEDDVALVQNARYLLENILNTVGVGENALARHPEHQTLVNACYWVDEIFKAAKAKIEMNYMA